jgi:ATP-dependent DNA helicase RecQ
MVATELNEIHAVLRRVWGFESLRPIQQEVVESAIANRDALVVMPTGGGKSLCFQLPAILSGRLTVVISPLIALMKDQVDALKLVGVSAAALNSSMSPEAENEIHEMVISGEVKLLYLSPERLLLPATMRLLKLADNGRGVARFAIDEAHCISAWGHDFRPEFRQLGKIKQSFPGVPIQAFTATATPKVQRDIAIQLSLERPRKFVGIFDRPNLTYRVVAKDDAVKRTIEAVERYPDEGVIVYCLSRKDTESVANGLVAKGIPAVAYHAGLPNDVRSRISEDFAQEKANIIVATVAFGMGIDRSNVRCVIHECLPKSMEGYQQETGRAGRDGLPSECVLLYNHGDIVRLKRLLSGGDSELVAHQNKLLEEVRRFATSHQCRHKSLSEHFGQDYEVDPEGCGTCDVCLGGMKPLENSSKIGHQILRVAQDLLARNRGFGVSFLSSVLVGSRVKAVIERQADSLEGFGSLSSFSSERVTSWVHQLMDIGLLGVTEGQYPIVLLTDGGQQAIDHQTEIILIENVALLEKASSKKSKSIEAPVENVDQILFEKLRVWRRETAMERNVPAYVIFHDATLMRIAAARPTSTEGLTQISGVGEKRGQDFGALIVPLIEKYCQEAGVSRNQLLVAARPSSKSVSSKSVAARSVAVVHAKYVSDFKSGKSIEDIAKAHGFTEGTIWRHLADWVAFSNPSSLEPWVNEDTRRKVESAIKECEGDALKPVFEMLNEEIRYEIIRVVKSAM